MSAKKCRVKVEHDHLEKVSSASPDRALAELIWNALDADATNIEIIFIDGELGTNEIVVRDNGNGFTFRDAESLFSSLGGSWKAHEDRSPGGRFLHGKEGQGRFKAFSLGRFVEWRVEGEAPFMLTGMADSLGEFTLEELEATESKRRGTTVTVRELSRNFRILDTAIAIERLLPVFALYLRTYSSIKIYINGEQLDPEKAINRTDTIEIGSVTYKENEHPVELEIIEWKNGADRELWYCTDSGFPLGRYQRQIRSIGDFGFSSYLKTSLVGVLNSEGTLGLGELNSQLREVSDAAIKSIKDHFAKRAIELGQSQIRKWKTENVYPFSHEAISPIEVAERQIFDIVAVKLSESLPSLHLADKKSKSFQLRMLRYAVENSPEDLQSVITEVLNLPKHKLAELSELLQDVSLSSMISASKLVSDRLKFLSGLEFLLFDPSAKKNLKERSQLHRIIAENSWLFGPEFAVSVDDQSLTEVLRKHSQKKGVNIPIDEPVTKVDGSKGIVDLMLSRSIPCNRDDEIEHLVVELKAPKVKIGTAECNQIEEYAYAVIDDERFSSLTATWNFWILSNEVAPVAKKKSNQDGRARGILAQNSENGVRVTIWVKEWSQIIKENKHRLEFIRDKLNCSVDRQQGIQHLREVYSEFTRGVTVNSESDEVEA